MGVVRMILYSWECPTCNRTGRTGSDFWEKKDAERDFALHAKDCKKQEAKNGL